MPARAFENGRHYLGHSCILSPDGKDAARAGAGEQVITAKLDVESVAVAQNRIPYLKDVTDLKNRLTTPD